ncbi:hypothetical protein MMC19_005985 [Ptychographa xylographoides]|nr:hypothetical protein [Ptychographa xylographoides]
MASNEVSSLVGDGMLFTAVEPFNYANLNYPVPWNVWAAQQGCISNSAACPFETGLYTPYVSLPSQILNLDPAWSTCTVDPMIGSWDPPYALQPELGSLTAASSLFTNYPVAGATPVSPLASNTAAVFSTLATGANLPTVQPWDPEGLTSPTPISNLPQNPGDTPSGFSSIFPHPEDSAFSDDHTAPVITIQNTAITANSASAYIVGSQTLIAGSTAIIVAGTPISLAPSASAIIIGGTTIPLPLSSTQAVPHISFGNSVYAADSGSTFIIGSQTLKPGGEITISGTTISLAIVASAVVVGETTFPLHDPSPLALPQITIASSIYTRDSFSDLIIGGQTLTPNGQITVSKTPISLAAGGTAVIIGGTTVPFKNVPSPTARPHIIVGSSVYFENSALDFIVDSQTLTAGGQIIVSGTTLYLEAAATAIVIDGSTFPVLPLTTPMPRLLPVLTLGSSIYTENFASNFIIGSQTLTPGGEITLSGTIGSFDASRTEIVIGTSTVGLGEVIISEFGPGVPTTVTVNEPVGIITGASGGAGTTRTTSAGEGESKTAMSENHGGTETPTISSAVTGAAAGGNPALYRAMMWGLFFAVVVW